MERAIAKLRWVAQCPFDFPMWSEIELAHGLREYAADLQRNGHPLKALAALIESRRLLARYRLEANARMPVRVLGRLQVSALRLVDGLITSTRRIFHQKSTECDSTGSFNPNGNLSN